LNRVDQSEPRISIFSSNKPKTYIEARIGTIDLNKIENPTKCEVLCTSQETWLVCSFDAKFSVADPDFELGGGPGLVLLALLAFLLSVISSFFTQNKGARVPRPPPLDPPLILCAFQRFPGFAEAK